MSDLTRDEFIELCGLTRRRFDSRARREAFPFYGARIESRYIPRYVLLTNLTTELSQLCNLPLPDACELAIGLMGKIRSAWDIICSTSKEVLEQKKDTDEVL